MVRCYTCGAERHWRDIHAGHCFTKGGHPATAFDLDNIKPQCSHCNTFQHGNVAKFVLNLQREIGFKRVQELETRAKTAFKFNRAWLEDQIEEYKKKLKEL